MRRISIYFFYFLLLSSVVYLAVSDNKRPDGWDEYVNSNIVEIAFGSKERLIDPQTGLVKTDIEYTPGNIEGISADDPLYDLLYNKKMPDSNIGGNYDDFKGSVSTDSKPRTGGVDNPYSNILQPVTEELTPTSVSYTHLTLPTKRIV